MIKRILASVAALALSTLPQAASAQVVVQGGVQFGIPAPPTVYVQPPQVHVQPVPHPGFVQQAPPGGYVQVDMSGDPTFDNAGFATMPPPAPIVEQAPPMPVPGHAWVPGYWRWRGNQYVWVRGRWMAPRAPGYAWNPGQWQSRGGRWHWRRGGWHRGHAMVQPVVAQPAYVQPVVVQHRRGMRPAYVQPAVVHPAVVHPAQHDPRWGGRGRGRGGWR